MSVEKAGGSWTRWSSVHVKALQGMAGSARSRAGLVTGELRAVFRQRGDGGRKGKAMRDMQALDAGQDGRSDASAPPGGLPLSAGVCVPASAGYLYSSLTSNLQSDSGEGCVAVYAFDFWDAFARGGF